MSNGKLSFQTKALIQQGYQSYTPQELKKLDWGLRFTPLVCMLLTLIGLLLQSPTLLITIGILGIWGFFLPAYHPMDLLYNNVVRHTFQAVAIPPMPFQRRLACLSAGVFNLLTALMFILGLPIVAFIMGGMLIALQIIVTTTHLCALSWVYEMILRALGRWNLPATEAELHQAFAQNALLVDVREIDEFARGSLPKAINIPLGELEKHLTVLQEKPVILYCASGMRSQIAAQKLKRLGLPHVFNLGAMARGQTLLTK